MSDSRPSATPPELPAEAETRDPLEQSFDRFTPPGEIPDAAVSPCAGRDLGPHAHRLPPEAPACAGAHDGEARGYAASHPAGRGWVPGSRDLGIPSEHEATRAPGTIVFDGVEHSFPFGVPDDVVAACGGSAVFDTERRVRFLDHLSLQGNVRAAAARAGISHETVYRKRRQDARFAGLWDAALIHARSYGESQLATRALDGIEVAVWHRGEIVGYETRHDTRLLLAHLARLDRKVEADTAEARAAVANAGRFDELLADYAGHEAPEGFAEAARDGLPPTRAEWVTHVRGEAIGPLPEEAGEAEAEAWRAAEAEAVEELGAEAGAEWDAWHEQAVALVEGIVAKDDSPIEVKSAPPRHGEGDHAQHGGGAREVDPNLRSHDEPRVPLHPRPAAGGPPPRAGEDPRNSAAANRVTPVNPRRTAGRLRCDERRSQEGVLPHAGHGSAQRAETGSPRSVGGSRGGAGLLIPPSKRPGPVPSLSSGEKRCEAC